MSIKHLLLAAALAMFAGSAKAVQDTITHHHGISIFAQLGKWWNPAHSWKEKYRDADRGDLRESFPFSTTILVSLTDAWHAFGLVHRAALLGCGVVVALGFRLKNGTWLMAAVIALYAVQAAVFHLLYTWIFV